LANSVTEAYWRSSQSGERGYKLGDRTPAVGNGDARTRGKDWRKSSYSMTNGHCLEAARLEGGRLGVRDSRAASGPILRITPGAWKTFVAALTAR
jgi:hypothetical protein